MRRLLEEENFSGEKRQQGRGKEMGYAVWGRSWGNPDCGKKVTAGEEITRSLRKVTKNRAYFCLREQFDIEQGGRIIDGKMHWIAAVARGRAP